jgi:hypothetical protein
LAFVPALGNEPGRFYTLILHPGGYTAVGMTEGNDSSTSASSRRLSQWYIGGAGPVDAVGSSGAALVYNASRDTNLRAVFSWRDGSRLSFLPIADGLVNHDYRDQNDYPLLKKNLPCAISGRCFRCQYLTRDGNDCGNWTR